MFIFMCLYAYKFLVVMRAWWCMFRCLRLIFILNDIDRDIFVDGRDRHSFVVLVTSTMQPSKGTTLCRQWRNKGSPRILNYKPSIDYFSLHDSIILGYCLQIQALTKEQI